MVEEMSQAPVSGAIQNLFGAGDENVRLLEQLLKVHIALRSGEITVEGEEEEAVDLCERVLSSLGTLCARGERVDTALVQYAVNLARKDELEQLDTLFKEVVATTFRGRPIRCKTLGQRDYVKAIKKNTLTFGIGPAGTGKTYLAMAMAVSAPSISNIAS